MFGVKRFLEEVADQESSLAAFCARFDPGAVPLEHSASVYEALARMEKLVAGARVRLAARVEESHHWRLAGHRTAADWLARAAGVTTGAAHAELAASTLLARLPATDDALRH